MGRGWGPGGIWALGTRDLLPQSSLPPQGKGRERLEGTGKKRKETTNLHEAANLLFAKRCSRWLLFITPLILTENFEINSVIIPILEMRKLRLGEVMTEILFRVGRWHRGAF